MLRRWDDEGRNKLATQRYFGSCGMPGVRTVVKLKMFRLFTLIRGLLGQFKVRGATSVKLSMSVNLSLCQILSERKGCFQSNQSCLHYLCPLSDWGVPVVQFKRGRPNKPRKRIKIKRQFVALNPGIDRSLEMTISFVGIVESRFLSTYIKQSGVSAVPCS